ncbi:MAG: hypothetical protein ACI4OT_02695 [Bacilli bacterium]
MKQIFTFKGLLTIIFIIFITIAIYYVFDPKQKTYIAMGDYYALGINSNNSYEYGYPDYIRDNLNSERKLKYFDKTYTKEKYTAKEMIKDIENNDFIISNGNTISIKRLLREADLLTITIGINDLNDYLNINNINQLQYLNQEEIDIALTKTKKDIENLIKEIEKYSKNKIVFVGYYFHNYKEYDKIYYTITNLNYIYQDLSNKYNIEYFKTTNLFNDKEIDNSSLYPNYKTYKQIADKITKKYKNAC